MKALRTLLASVAVLATALIVSAPALADEPTHSLSKVIKATKTCPLNEPLDLAVNEKTGDIYVTDVNEAGKHHVERFNAAGECLKSWAVPAAESIAVDNSNSPDAGDVYVVGASELESEEHNKVRRYSPEGAILSSFTKVRTNSPEEKPAEFEELTELQGVGVDATGKLWLSAPANFAIFEFNADEKNTYTFNKIEPFLEVECQPLAGFAVTAHAENFYTGRDRELKNETCQIPEETPAILKLNSAGEPAATPQYEAQLDAGPTHGVAVNQTTGTVYFDDGTSVAAFDSSGKFLERFGYKESEALLSGSGVAVDAATNQVFAPDALNQTIDVFGPAAPPPPHEPVPPLPDHRVAQLVSPPLKHGSSILANPGDAGLIRAAEDGSAIAYLSNGPLVEDPPINRAPEASTSLSRRAPDGTWTTQDLGTPRTKALAYKAGQGTEYRFFNSQLTSAFLEPMMGIFEAHEAPLAPVAAETTLYRRNITGPAGSCEPVPSTCYQPLVSSLDPHAAGYGGLLHFQSATPDGNHAVFYTEEPLALTGEPTEGQNPMFEWNAGEGGGTLERVNVAPPGEEGAGAGATLGEFSGGFAGFSLEAAKGFRHAISNDGNRVVWSAEHSVYVRDMAKHETLRLDVAEAGVPTTEEEALAEFKTASTDGSRIFFTDERPLMKDSTSELEALPSEGQADLYECEVVEREGKLACNLTDLTTTTRAPNEAASVQNVVGTSEDGTTIYYVADGDLAPGAGRGHCGAAEVPQERTDTSSCNLYVQHRGAKGWEAPRFVSRLSITDFPDWNPGQEGMTSRVSPNGQYAAFMSSLPVTGYDNHDENALAGGARDQEAYLYSAAANTVTCVSCNPSGNRPHGAFDRARTGEGNGLIIDRPFMWKGQWVAGDIGGWTSNVGEYGMYQSRNLDDSGRLFFNSADPLVAMATPLRTEEVGEEKTQVGVTNAYEFEPNGLGTCTSPNGCISLLSGGNTAHESEFLEADALGENAFVYTSSQMQPSADHDFAFDVYDVGACSGAGCSGPPPIEESRCTTEPAETTCKGPSGPVSPLPPVPPTTAPGAGNSGTVVVLPFTEVGPPKPPVKLTTRQLLEKALTQCHKKKNKKKRAACEKQARKKFHVKSKKSAHKARRAHR